MRSSPDPRRDERGACSLSPLVGARYVSVVRALGVAAVVVVVSVGVGGAAVDASGGRWLPPAPFDLHGGGVSVVIVSGGGAVALSDQYAVARTSTFSASSGWSPITPLADAAPFFGTDLAVDGRGNALVTGALGSGGPPIAAYQRAAGSTTWTGPIGVSGSERVWAGSSLAANAAGEAVVAWSTVDVDGQLLARAAVRRSDGTWEPPQGLGYGGFDTPAVSIDARGDTVVVGRAARWTSRVAPRSTPSVGRQGRPGGQPLCCRSVPSPRTPASS